MCGTWKITNRQASSNPLEVVTKSYLMPVWAIIVFQSKVRCLAVGHLLYWQHSSSLHGLLGTSLPCPALFLSQFLHFLVWWSFFRAFSCGSFLLHLIFVTSSFIPWITRRDVLHTSFPLVLDPLSSAFSQFTACWVWLSLPLSPQPHAGWLFCHQTL